MQALETALKRYVRRISIYPLAGTSQTFISVADAVAGVASIVPGIDAGRRPGQAPKFDVTVDYSNRDSIRASFTDPEPLVAFLQRL